LHFWKIDDVNGGADIRSFVYRMLPKSADVHAIDQPSPYLDTVKAGRG
jgi:translation initiation factor RLI1